MSDALQLILEDTDGTQLETSCTRFAVVWQGKEVWIQAVGDQLLIGVDVEEGDTEYANLLLRLMERFPIIVTLGAALLGYVGGEMAVNDLAVVGFGDSDVSRVCQPPLTTMAVPQRKIGIEAGKALLERLNDGDWRDQKPIASSLCLRESC